GHHGLAFYAELLSELVYPDLRHYAPCLGPLIRASQPVRGSACSVRRQFLLFIAACSSSAHHNLSRPPVPVLPRHPRALPPRLARSGHFPRAPSPPPCPCCPPLPPLPRPPASSSSRRDSWPARHRQAVPSRAALSGSPGGAWLAPSSPC